MPTAPLLSASAVLGSRPGSVAVRVSGCPGCAWLWRPAYRPGGSIASGRALACRIPGTAADPAASARTSAATLARRFGLRVSVRVAPGGTYWLKCSGDQGAQLAAARWWAGVLRGHAATVAAMRARGGRV
jgi:hypothetical protein